MRPSKIFLIAVLAGSFAACSNKASAPAPSLFKVTATIQDLMEAEVDASADYLWEAVGTISTEKGVDERQPRSPEEWARARQHTIILMEATNLLVMDGRKVAAPDKKIADQEIPGALNAAQVQQLIDNDHASFVAFAHALHDVAAQMLKAIDEQSPQGMLDAGDALDSVCEACHQKYWYPEQATAKPPG
jgi:hypothetical protein